MYPLLDLWKEKEKMEMIDIEKVKDILYRFKAEFDNEIYDNEDITQDQIDVADKVLEQYMDKVTDALEDEVIQ